MPFDFKSVAQSAHNSGALAAEHYIPLSIFPKYYEPEAKIDLVNSIRCFDKIRQCLANPPNDKLQTSIVPGSIRMGGHAMMNIIVEPYSTSGIPLFLKNNKFMRIAGRVDELGQLYEVKIALKCLSQGVEVRDGLPFRQEFEPTLPKGMSLEQGFNWFMQQYKEHYKSNVFDNVTYQSLRPTSAYMSTRTGYEFLRQHHKRKLTFVNEACEDLVVPMGPDLETHLCDFKNAECQFEWETVGAFVDRPTHDSISEQERIAIGLKSMRNTLKHLIFHIHPKVHDHKEFIVVDSKAEISRERTLLDDRFAFPFPRSDRASNFNGIAGTNMRDYIHLLRKRTRPMHEALTDCEVRESMCRVARTIEKTRTSYNKQIKSEHKQVPGLALES